MYGVSIAAVRALAMAVQSRGVAQEEVLARLKLRVADLEEDRARVSFDVYHRMVRAALMITGDSGFGLHMGEAAPALYDVLGLLAQHSANLRSALQMVNHYARIVTEGPRVQVREHGDSASIRLLVPGEGTPEALFFAELATSGLVLHLVRLFGEPARPIRVYFAYEAPMHRADYARVFAGREQFSHPFTGVEIERSWLDRAYLHRSVELHTTLRIRADLLLARLDRDVPGSERVKRWLASQPFERKPRMRDVATDLGMSARSLRRLLAREATDFTELAKLARAERSINMLGTGHYTVQETAYALGFSSPGAFTRAFKHWTGKTPGEIRRAR